VNWIDRSSPGQVFDVGAAPAAHVPFVAITCTSFTRAIALEAYGTWCGADPLHA
jgi:hypothetical protein